MNYFNYFTEIEDTFVRRRGRHLFLSPMDWALIESWKQMGVPLHVALRAIEKAFDSYQAKPRARSVKSLFYCQEEVEAQFEEWLEGQRGATTIKTSAPDLPSANGAAPDSSNGLAANVAQTVDPADAKLPFPRATILGHLHGIGTEIAAARARCTTETPGNAAHSPLIETLTRVEARLAELTEDFARAARPDAEQLEAALTDLENLLDASLLASAPAASLQSWQAETVMQLQAYRKNMDQELYAQTARNLTLKRARAHFGVPRFSLFHL